MLYNFKMVKYHNKNIDTKKILKEAFQITHILPFVTPFEGSCLTE